MKKLPRLHLGLMSLIPFLTFLVLYISMGVWFSFQGSDYAFYQFPAASCAVMGFAVALLLGIKKLDETIKVFCAGIADENIILMCLIFMFAGSFATVTKGMGGVDAVVQMGLSCLPSSALLPGIFLIACMVSMALGTSMGTISTVVPIAMGIAVKTGLDLPLTVGTVVGGAMFGDNLSVISDTTVAATSSQGCSMRSKMVDNLKIAMPAALIVVVALFFSARPTAVLSTYDFSLIKISPYLLVLGLALMGIHVIAVLIIGIVWAGLVGVLSESMSFIAFGKGIYEGFLSMSDIFFLTILTAGLASLATHGGGLDYILDKVQRFIRSKKTAELGIASIVSVADFCTANNTVAIVITGKMARKIADKFKVPAARAASMLDIFSCVCQGLIPHGAQVLLASGLAQLSPFRIIPYIWYPALLGFFALISIAIGWPKSQKHV
ncbi:MAG: Na+/H+ antiporter NhaC family protein [Oligoflexales bacterium]|nr:Na+/H+ antiporter NhaC family protein [Oligoflexales bacterium]